MPRKKINKREVRQAQSDEAAIKNRQAELDAAKLIAVRVGNHGARKYFGRTAQGLPPNSKSTTLPDGTVINQAQDVLVMRDRLVVEGAQERLKKTWGQRVFSAFNPVNSALGDGAENIIDSPEIVESSQGDETMADSRQTGKGPGCFSKAALQGGCAVLALIIAILAILGLWIKFGDAAAGGGLFLVCCSGSFLVIGVVAWKLRRFIGPLLKNLNAVK